MILTTNLIYSLLIWLSLWKIKLFSSNWWIFNIWQIRGGLFRVFCPWSLVLGDHIIWRSNNHGFFGVGSSLKSGFFTSISSVWRSKWLINEHEFRLNDLFAPDLVVFHLFCSVCKCRVQAWVKVSSESVYACMQMCVCMRVNVCMHACKRVSLWLG